MLPMICIECQKRHPGNPDANGIYHGRDYDTPCIICGHVGAPATLIHLAIPCESSEAHPLLPGGKGIFASNTPPHKILCGYGPRLPRHLTTSPNAATCYHCLKQYRQINLKPVESESPQ